MTRIEPPITADELMAYTGLGPVQVRADVRAGLLPGRMRGRKLILTAAEFRRWQNGDWIPKPEPITTDHQPTFLKRRAS